jgi:hypothetical protein
MQPDLSHLKRCDQPWGRMPPVPGGRACGTCQKTIVDFRGMSGADIALVHARSETPVCGIYSGHRVEPGAGGHWQLRRPASGIAIVVGASLLGTGVAAAPAPPAPTAEYALLQTRPGQGSKPADVPADVQSPGGDTLTIRGTVRGPGGEPAPGTIVWLTGTDTRTVADSTGAFVLRRVQRNDDVRPDSIVFLRLGYSRTSVALGAGTSLSIDAVLEPATPEMTAFYVTAKGPSRWQRIGRALRSLF